MFKNEFFFLEKNIININSNIENSNKLFNIISLKKKFDNIEQIKNDLIKICGDLYKNFEFEEKNNIINLELVNSSSRKIMEPLFKQIFNK